MLKLLLDLSHSKNLRMPNSTDFCGPDSGFCELEVTSLSSLIASLCCDRDLTCASLSYKVLLARDIASAVGVKGLSLPEWKPKAF